MGGYDTEWRLPFTIDGQQNARGISWFGGGGLAYNMDDLGDVDAMLTGGLDKALNRRLVVNLTINFIWQSAIMSGCAWRKRQIGACASIASVASAHSRSRNARSARCAGNRCG